MTIIKQNNAFREITGNLRNSLTAILMLIELLKADRELTKTQQMHLDEAYINDILKAGAMIINLTKQLETRHLN